MFARILALILALARAPLVPPHCPIISPSVPLGPNGPQYDAGQTRDR